MQGGTGPRPATRGRPVALCARAKAITARAPSGFQNNRRESSWSRKTCVFPHRPLPNVASSIIEQVGLLLEALLEYPVVRPEAEPYPGAVESTGE